MSTVDILQSLGIVFSLVVAVYQMRLYIKAEKISVVTRISERNDALLDDLIAHHVEIRNFAQPFNPEEKAYFGDPRVSIMYRILNFFDEMFYYHRQDFVAPETWRLYRNTLRKFLDNPFAETFWAHARDEYNPGFQEFVTSVFENRPS